MTDYCFFLVNQILLRAPLYLLDQLRRVLLQSHIELPILMNSSKLLQIPTQQVYTFRQIWPLRTENLLIVYSDWFRRAKAVRIIHYVVLPGQELKSSSFKSLRWLVHTGFYSYPGTYKFRVKENGYFQQSLVYASKNFNRLQLPNSTTD